jgi:hypothetical protein
MKKILAVILILSFHQSFAQNNPTSPVAITIKLNKEYYVTKKKDDFKRVIKEFGYVVKSDSVKQKYYDVTIEIKNTDVKPTSIWLMKCSWWRNFLVNNDYISIKEWGCDGNFPTLVKFNQGERKIYQATLVKSIKFDYPCEDCIYGRQVEATKLGLIIINESAEHGYFLAMEDKSKWKIVWSNSLKLLGRGSK